MAIASRPYGILPDGRSVELYELACGRGVRAGIITYGASIVSVVAPDRDGAGADVVLGFDALEGYLSRHPYFGGTIGRYANRIAHGRFALDGVTYQLACNDGPHHLHGGRSGFDRRVWTAAVREESGDAWLDMRYVSADGEEGYPGALEVTVSYGTTGAGELIAVYRARCGRRTVVNLTNHAYFNLAGGGDVLDHVFHLAADGFLPIDATLIPTGEVRPVHGTPMDFRVPASLRARIGLDDPQLRNAGAGYDHTWTLQGMGGEPRVAARVYEPHSGRALEIATTQPGMQLYTGNQLDGSIAGKRAIRYGRHAGFCLEPQRFPDAPNQAAFPPAVLDAGDTYQQTTIYRFGVGAF